MSGASCRSLQEYLDAEYEVVVRKAAKGYTVCIPSLGLAHTGKELEASYASLSAKKEAHLREFAAEELLHLVPFPGDSGASQVEANSRSVLQQVKPFLVKAAISALLFFGAVNVIGQGLGDTGYKLEKQLEGLSNWSPEQVEWHRARSAKIAEKLGPTMRELLVMFRGPAPAGAPGEVVPVVPSVALEAGEAAKPATAPAAGPVVSGKP